VACGQVKGVLLPGGRRDDEWVRLKHHTGGASKVVTLAQFQHLGGAAGTARDWCVPSAALTPYSSSEITPNFAAQSATRP
jgi:hypothetical protein